MGFNKMDINKISYFIKDSYNKILQSRQNRKRSSICHAYFCMLLRRYYSMIIYLIGSFHIGYYKSTYVIKYNCSCLLIKSQYYILFDFS